jgi:hypothetical protein
MAKQVIEPIVEDMQRLPMTYEEYLERFDESTRVEWVNGEAIVYRPPNEPHQDAITLLVSLLRWFVDMDDLGVVLTAPFELKLPVGWSREPDILFLSRARFDLRTEKRWLGADLVIEGLSESTARYDLGDPRAGVLGRRSPARPASVPRLLPLARRGLRGRTVRRAGALPLDGAAGVLARPGLAAAGPAAEGDRPDDGDRAGRLPAARAGRLRPAAPPGG